MGYPGDHKYTYRGPVKEFGKVIATDWSASTSAPSEKKARSNLAYQFKKQYNRCPSANITLPGAVKQTD